MFGETGKIYSAYTKEEYDAHVKHCVAMSPDGEIKVIAEPGGKLVKLWDLPESAQELLIKYWEITIPKGNILEVGIDTGPGQQPRSIDYNKEGMLLEGWEACGGPFFGMSWFRTELDTHKQAVKAKKITKLAMELLYEQGIIRGARFKIR